MLTYICLQKLSYPVLITKMSTLQLLLFKIQEQNTLEIIQDEKQRKI